MVGGGLVAGGEQVEPIVGPGPVGGQFAVGRVGRRRTTRAGMFDQLCSNKSRVGGLGVEGRGECAGGGG